MPVSQDFTLDALTNGQIETKGSLAQRLDYAWSIYNSRNKAHEAYKQAALEFLKKSFGAESVETITELMKVRNANSKKNPNFVPELKGMQLKMPLIGVLNTSTDIESIKIGATNITPKDFFKLVNGEIKTLNNLIKDYNKNRQLNTLFQIYRKQKELNERVPPPFIPIFPEYEEIILNQLFKSLKDQLASHGINTLKEQAIQLPRTSPQNKTQLSELITNMSPEKVDVLLEILSKGKKFSQREFSELYKPYEAGYTQFQQFLSQYTIEFLGGGNSTNFKVTHTYSGDSFVLKAENRLNSAKTAEAHLRSNSMKEVFTSVKAAREGTISGDGYREHRTLLVTDFCQGYDLVNFAKIPRPDSEQITMALTIYLQMGETLQAIIDDGCAFPDMKNSNWLIENGKLQIADTKTFAFIAPNSKNLNYAHPKNWAINFLATTYINPPEFKVDAIALINCSADKAHAYMFGKNLYQFLTKVSAKDMMAEDGSSLNFNFPIFLTPQGKQFKQLILDLVKPAPAQRMSMQQALTCLKRISETQELAQAKKQCSDKLAKFSELKVGWNDENISRIISENTQIIYHIENLEAATKLQKQLDKLKTTIEDEINIKAAQNSCTEILEQIKSFQFGEKDTGMTEFVKENQLRIDQCADTAQLKNINKELVKIHDQMSAPAVATVRRLIDTFRKDSRFYTIGMKAKAQRIEQAMINVPVQERANINNKETSEVLKALASHRHPFRGSALNQDGTINATKAARSFRMFKEAIAQNNTNEHDNSPNNKPKQ